MAEQNSIINHIDIWNAFAKYQTETGKSPRKILFRADAAFPVGSVFGDIKSLVTLYGINCEIADIPDLWKFSE